MHHLLPAVLLSIALLDTGSLQAQEFEGLITVHMTGTTRDGTQIPDVEYMSRKGMVRLNVRSPMGSIGVIAIPAEKKLYALMDAQSAYMEQPLSFDIAATTPAPVVTRTGKKETIAGYECEHILIAGQPGSMDVCMARGLGPFVAATVALGGQSMPAWQRALLADGGFPLKVIRADGTTQLEVTKIEKKRLSDALFTVPDNYTKMDMPRRRP